MRILEHKTTASNGKDKHHYILLDWFDCEWKIMLNENHIKQITTAHVYDNGWRVFDNRTQSEAIIYDALKADKIVKLKYKVQ